MRWIAPISLRVADKDTDRMLRNYDERIRQLVKHVGGTDHGDLDGRADDDHTQYLLADGTRALTGDMGHGDRTIVLSVGMGSTMTSGGAFIAPEISAAFDWRGRFQANAVGNIAAIPLPLLIGDRVKSINFYYYAAGTTSVRVSLITTDVVGAQPVVQETTTSILTGYRTLPLTVSPEITVAAATPIWVQFRSGQSGDRFYAAEVTYDRPKPS